MTKPLRYILAPFASAYGLVLKTRHLLYDKNVLKSAEFNFPIICVGNLALGGTGKTPMVEYLVRLLKNDFKVATLSRGYKRKTKGYILANTQTTALEIGDEPMQFHAKFPDITVAVGEERVVAIPQLLFDRPETEVIILDDAFQHRSVRPALNILLTEYANIYSKDWLVPAGSLRDVSSASQRADVIVVTKCPADISVAEKDSIAQSLKPNNNQQLFFTTLRYAHPAAIFSGDDFVLTKDVDVMLVNGIANPKPLVKYLEENVGKVSILNFPDHHIYTSADLKKIIEGFDKLSNKVKIILTTEKDAMRLHKFKSELAGMPVFYLPVVHEFLFNEANTFNAIVVNTVKNFKK